MNLIEIIQYFRREGSARVLMAEVLPNVEVDQIDVYLKGNLDLNAEVNFFDVETIPNDLLIEINGIKYINLFPFFMLQEMIEDYSNLTDQVLSDIDIAKRLLDYRIKDA